MLHLTRAKSPINCIYFNHTFLIQGGFLPCLDKSNGSSNEFHAQLLWRIQALLLHCNSERVNHSVETDRPGNPKRWGFSVLDPPHRTNSGRLHGEDSCSNCTWTAGPPTQTPLRLPLEWAGPGRLGGRLLSGACITAILSLFVVCVNTSDSI